MTDKKTGSAAAADLRQRAEAVGKEKWSDEELLTALSPLEIRRILHELRVHQVELEMQNEELRRTQAELDAARARYFDLYDLAPVGYCTISEDGLILEANLTAVTLLGMPRRALVQQPLSRFIFKDDQDLYYLKRAKFLTTGKPQGCDLRVVKKDGAMFWAHLIGIASSDNEGAPTCRVVLDDITERKQAEEALRSDRQRFAAIIKGTHVGTWEWNVQTGETIFNERWAEIIGYTLEELAPVSIKTWNTLTHPEDLKVSDELLEKHFRGELDYYECELRMKHKDGNWVWLLDRGQVMTWTKDGKPLMMLGTHQDITERKAAEAEKAKLESELQQARKIESIGRLAGGVAHDFNNMLGVILGHLEFALEQVNPAQPLHADLEEVQKAARRSAALTRQLLAFARKQTIMPKILNLNETVDGTLKMLRRLIGENVDLVWQPGADLWPVNMDPSQIDQILANFCVNARDAIGGVGKIVLETGNASLDQAACAKLPELSPGKYVRLAVSDNGCGMDRDTLDHLFEPFFTTKEFGESAGLGLATVYGIVKQNHGFIYASSEPGKGSVFTIYLPRHRGVKAQGSADATAVAAPAARGHETILLVEDEPTVLSLTTRMLELQGYTVLAAGSPGDAFRLAREHAGKIHLILADVIMPEMNGWDLTQNLLALYPHIKRVFMSGYTADIIAHHGVVEADVNFIQKPFSGKELAAKIREALDAGSR